jgi:hypothetical protein
VTIFCVVASAFWLDRSAFGLTRAHTCRVEHSNSKVVHVDSLTLVAVASQLNSAEVALIPGFMA